MKLTVHIPFVAARQANWLALGLLLQGSLNRVAASDSLRLADQGRAFTLTAPRPNRPKKSSPV
jgi:hypothetical protein